MILWLIIIMTSLIIIFYLLFINGLMINKTKYKKVIFKNYSDMYYYSEEDSSLDKKMKIKTKF